MEELKKEFNNKSSKNYKKDNQKLFNNLIIEIYFQIILIIIMKKK